jgi:chromosome segregation ATPase
MSATTAPPSLEFVLGRLDAINNNINDARRSLLGVLARFDGLETRFGVMEGRFSGLESRFASLEKRLGFMEERQEAMQATLTRVSDKMLAHDARFDAIDAMLAAILAKLP